MRYQDMVVWKVAKEITQEVFILTQRLSRAEYDVFGKQLRRAAVSIGSNFVEGRYRGTRKEYARFISIAIGSASEVECQLHLARATGTITTDITPLLRKIGKEISMLINLRRSLLSPNPL